MPNFKCQDAVPDDLANIVEIYNSTVASRMVTADTEPVSVASRLDWFHSHNPATRPLWVIENDAGEMLGWVSFKSFYGRPAYNGTVELAIYLAVSARGRGLGAEVLQYCLAKAPALSIKTLLGFIFAHNEPSLKLFKRFGFETWGDLPNIAVLDGHERSLKILGKRVG